MDGTIELQFHFCKYLLVPILQACSDKDLSVIADKLAHFDEYRQLPTVNCIAQTLIQACAIIATKRCMPSMKAIFMLADGNHDTGAAVVQKVALHLKFRTNFDLVGSSLPQIISGWDQPLEKLPYSLVTDTFDEFIDIFKAEIIDGMVLGNKVSEIAPHLKSVLLPPDADYQIFSSCILFHGNLDSFESWGLSKVEPNPQTKAAVLIKVLSNIKDLNSNEKIGDPTPFSAILADLSLPSLWLSKSNTCQILNSVGNIFGCPIETLVDNFDDPELFSLLYHYHKELVTNRGQNDVFRNLGSGYTILIALVQPLLQKYDFVVRYCAEFLLRYLQDENTITGICPILRHLFGHIKEFDVIPGLICSLSDKFNALSENGASDEILDLICLLVKLAPESKTQICALALDQNNSSTRRILQKFGIDSAPSSDSFEYWFGNLAEDYWGQALCYLDTHIDLQYRNFSIQCPITLRTIMVSRFNPPYYETTRFRKSYFSVLAKIAGMCKGSVLFTSQLDFDSPIEGMSSIMVGYIWDKDTAIADMAINSLNILANRSYNSAVFGKFHQVLPFRLIALDERVGRKQILFDSAAKIRQNELKELTMIALKLLKLAPDKEQIIPFQQMLKLSSDYTIKVLPLLFHYTLRESNVLQAKTVVSIVLDALSRPDFVAKNILNVLKVITFNEYLFKACNEEILSKSLCLDYSFVANAASTSREFHFGLYLIERVYIEQGYIPNSLWQVALSCYKGIQEKDGFNGVLFTFEGNKIDMFQLSQQKRMHDKDWIAYWSAADSELQSASDKSSPELLIGLSNSGHFGTLGLLFTTNAGENMVDGSNQYQTLWRLGKWDHFDNGVSTEVHPDKLIFDRLQRLSLTHCLANFANESNLDHIHNLTSISVVELDEANLVLSGQLRLPNLLSRWESRAQALETQLPFESLEFIHSVRQKVLDSFFRRKELHFASYSEQTIDFMRKQARKFLNLAISASEVVVSRRVLHELKVSYGYDITIELQMDLELLALNIEWQSGERDIAIRYLERLDQSCSNIADKELKARILHQYASWCIKSRKLAPGKIIEDYLLPATKLIPQSWASSEYRPPVYYDFAMYCDQLQNNMDADETHKRALVLLRQRESDLQQLQKLPHLVQTNSMTELHIRKLSRQIALDKDVISAFDRERLSYALHSCQNHLKSLITTNEKTEHSVFKFLSQWFGNDKIADMNNVIAKYLPAVPSMKLLDILHQATARLFAKDPDGSMFYANLVNMVLQIIEDFPYHALGFVLAAKNVSREKRGSATLSAESISAFLAQIKAKKAIHHIAYGMDGLFTAYLQLANNTSSKIKSHQPTKLHIIDKSSKLFKIGVSMKVPVVTAAQPMIPRDYSNVIHVCNFEKTFTIPGGINAPKVLKCLGSDGIVYKQLVKGKDDLRQDAVISSVFEIINKLLKKRKSTNDRNLGIRTYKIVSIASQAGVVQWVNGTTPFGDYLHLGYLKDPPKSSLHACRSKMKKEHDKPKSTLEQKVQVYESIEQDVHPILAKLFFQEFRDPVHWYQCRQQYTKSVAVSSMAGYVLGIGDRHSSNLLIDKATAEIIHIDLGIAFDQGRLLSTPEMVPFRLTRNMSKF